MDMTKFLIILGIYIGMVILSLLGPYIYFRMNYCEKGKKYSLYNLFKCMDDDMAYPILCLFPGINIVTIPISILILLYLILGKGLLTIMKKIRIV